MELIYIMALLITGIGVGFASGLLGVGGCFIMVPVQYWVLTTMGIDPTIAIRVAFGTNLLVVLPTAISGAFGHTRKGVVRWNPAIIMGLIGAIGAVAGAVVASNLSGIVLKSVFGIAILIGAVRMLTAKPPKIEKEPPTNSVVYALWGILIGFCCGLIGIGGGVLMVPIMVLALHFKMHEAVGTSTAVMIFTSMAGAFAYAINGFGLEGLPSYSIGYVNMLQWVLLAGTSIPMAQVGVKVAHKLPAKKLKFVFIVVMVYMALKMLGIFEWIGLPL
jgi:hypothetical protein